MQLSVVDAATPQQFIFQSPRMRTFRIFLHMARHDRIAAAADGHIQRGTGLARICKACRETGAFDETLGLENGLHSSHLLSLPMRVAVLFNFGGKWFSLVQTKIGKRLSADYWPAASFCFVTLMTASNHSLIFSGPSTAGWALVARLA